MFGEGHSFSLVHTVAPTAVCINDRWITLANKRAASGGSLRTLWVGCGGRIRTDDLRVMSPTGCHCPTPRASVYRIDPPARHLSPVEGGADDAPEDLRRAGGLHLPGATAGRRPGRGLWLAHQVEPLPRPCIAVEPRVLLHGRPRGHGGDVLTIRSV